MMLSCVTFGLLSLFSMTLGECMAIPLFQCTSGKHILFLEMCVQNRGPFRSVFNTRHLIINHHQDSQFDIWVEDFPFIFVPYLLRVLSTLLIVEIYSSCSSDCWASDVEVEIGRSSIPHFPLKGTFFFSFSHFRDKCFTSLPVRRKISSL